MSDTKKSKSSIRREKQREQKKEYQESLIAFRAKKDSLYLLKSELYKLHIKEIDDQIASMKECFSETCKHGDVTSIQYCLGFSYGTCQDCGKEVKRYDGFDTEWI